MALERWFEPPTFKVVDYVSLSCIYYLVAAIKSIQLLLFSRAFHSDISHDLNSEVMWTGKHTEIYCMWYVPRKQKLKSEGPIFLLQNCKRKYLIHDMWTFLWQKCFSMRHTYHITAKAQNCGSAVAERSIWWAAPYGETGRELPQCWKPQTKPF